MIKKFLILVLAILPFTMKAQFGAGEWITHTRYAIASTQNVIDTKNYVYSVVKGTLYRFDKATKTQMALDQTNGLSDMLIIGTYYNPEKDYVVVAYDDSNIDLIKSDGSVQNISGIKDAVMRQDKTINDVTFGSNNRIYVATGFGYVVINDQTYQLSASYLGTVAVNSVAEVGEWLLAYRNGNICYAKTASNPENFAQFKSVAATAGKIVAIDSSSFFVLQSAALHKMTMSAGNNDSINFTDATLISAVPTNMQRTPTGFLCNFLAAKYYYTYDATGNNGTKVSGGQALFSSYPGGDGELWSVTASGLHSSKATATYYKPEAISINGYPWWMVYSKRYHKLYLMSSSDNAVLGTINSGALYEANAYDGTTWTNVSPTGTTGSQGWYWPIIDPNDTTDSYYISTRLSGVFKVTDGKVAKLFNATNTPFVARKAAIRFDSQGNLWFAQSSLSTATPAKVLPAAKLKDLSTLATSDWTTYQIPDMINVNSFKRNCLAITTRDIKAFSIGDYGQGVIIWKNDSDVTTGNFTAKTFESFPTTKSGTMTWSYIYALESDRAGNLMIGNEAGFAFCNPDNFMSEDFAVEVPDVLDGSVVYCCTTDTLNRKWVGTNGDGIYVLSPDCKSVVKHFTSDDSKLISNVIYQMCCNEDDNSMYIVTPTAVQQYFGDFTPSADNYDNVYAFPNPVMPTYTGYVTIKNLMANSTVVIKDANGNMVKQLVSEGGLAIWDACDANGNRVPTGTYSIYAAQGGAEMPAKPYAKVNVIK